MSLRDPVLAVHIASGVAGLLLGPVAMLAPASRRRHVAFAGGAYVWTVLVVSLSAAALALLRIGELWWFLPIAALTLALALRGRLAAVRRAPGWRGDHISGTGGSYIALVTALIVVSAGGAVVAWILPTMIGVPVIHIMRARAARGAIGASRAAVR